MEARHKKEPITHRGSCHGGRLQFEVGSQITGAPFSRPRDLSRWAVNARCIEGLDLAMLTTRPFDAETAAQEFRRA